jgi:hypothetical protein
MSMNNYDSHRPHLMWLSVAMLLVSTSVAMATPWTIDRGDGVHIPNPACNAQTCPNTAQPPHELHGNSAESPLPETHNGFSCAHSGRWVYHPAARPRMTPEHDAAAKAEALGRLARLGDKARDMKCRPWQIAAGFKIASVLR